MATDGPSSGLWVTHNIIEKMGRATLVESTVAKSSPFTVEAPILAPERK